VLELLRANMEDAAPEAVAEAPAASLITEVPGQSGEIPVFENGAPGTEPTDVGKEMEPNSVFDDLAESLKGVVVLEEPRVPRKVLVKALRQHTITIKKVTNEIGTAKHRIAGVERQCDELRGLIKLANQRMDAMDVLIKEAQEAIARCEEQLAAAMKKLEKIDELEAICEEHTRQIGVMEVEQRRAKKEMDEYKVETAEKFEKEREERRALEARFSALDDYVMNRLMVTSDQVVVGSKEEYAEKPEEMMKLSVVLKATDATITENQANIATNKKQLKKHTEELSHKAGAHIEPLVEEHQAQIKNLIEVTGAGGGGARMADLEARISESTKGVKNATIMVDDLKEQMLEKCDKGHVDEKIEAKYEEIIDHLQSALSSAGEDEDEFKRVSMELQEICQQLASTKADKRDLLEVKEQVLFDSRVREQVEQLREFVDLKMNKDDVAEGLAGKPDRAELESRIKELGVMMKKQMRKVAAAAADGGGGGGEPILSSNPMSTAANPSGGQKPGMHAALTWKRGPQPIPPHVPIAETGPSFGGGFQMGAVPGGAPPLRPGRQAGTDLMPMLPREQDLPAHNPSNNLVVGVDGIIYHGANPKNGKAGGKQQQLMSASGPAPTLPSDGPESDSNYGAPEGWKATQ